MSLISYQIGVLILIVRDVNFIGKSSKFSAYRINRGYALVVLFLDNIKTIK